VKRSLHLARIVKDVSLTSSAVGHVVWCVSFASSVLRISGLCPNLYSICSCDAFIPYYYNIYFDLNFLYVNIFIVPYFKWRRITLNICQMRRDRKQIFIHYTGFRSSLEVNVWPLSDNIYLRNCQNTDMNYVFLCRAFFILLQTI
jgi:hypothetical protein